MPQVPETIRNRVRRHLGYNSPRGVNPATKARLQESFESMESNDDIYGRPGPSVITYLERCERLWRLTDPTDSATFSQFQQIIGDVNRQTRTLTIQDALKDNKEAYYLATDDLAHFLNVPNLQRPNMSAYVFAKYGHDYVLTPPGAADTCISDRIYLSRNYA